jgi:serine/threonine-protein kinase
VSRDSQAAPFNPLPALQAGLAGRYQIGEPLGRGGMAIVYAARDLRHDRDVAIKVVNPGLVAEQEAADRFLREIRYAATLTHPHILPLYDSGTVAAQDPAAGASGPRGSELLYYVMPRLSGESLRTRLQQERMLPVEQALRLIRSVAHALDYAHRRQVVHRDIKPENILLQEGEAVIADFGVARGLCETCDTDTVTEPGIAIGTPAYMSPEQASADPSVDGRSDQYSLACVLYEMLAGQPPFAGTGARATMARHASEPVAPLTAIRPEVPLAVQWAILRALAKEPGERYPTLAEFAEALVTPLSGLPAPAAIPQGRSIAVLPFVNASADPDSEYFADGMTEELINALAQVPGLTVASRSSSFALKGRVTDVRQVGQLLGVSAVLEGSVRNAGTRLRVTAQLTDVTHGRLIWSDRYDADDRDVFALQDQLAGAIVARLREELAVGLREPERHRGTASVAAYNLYLKGRYAWNQRTADGVGSAIRFFEQAIAVDPNYALAYAGLSDGYALHVDYRAAPVAAGMEKARELAEKAIAIDDGVAEAHTSLAWVTFIHDWDWPRAGREFRRAIELNPRYATARQWHAWYLAAMGRMAEALPEASRAVELDPASISIHRGLGWLQIVARQPALAVRTLERALVMNPEALETYVTLGLAREAAGRLVEAEAALREALLLGPEETHALAALGRVLWRQGRRAEAEAIADRFGELKGRRYVSPTDQAKLALGLEDHDGAFAALELARQERRGWLAYLKVEPLLDPIRGDPRFGALLRVMRLE